MSDPSDDWELVWNEMSSRKGGGLIAANFPSMEKAVEAVSRLPFLENIGADHPRVEMKNGLIGQAFQTRNGPAILLLGGALTPRQFVEAKSVCAALGKVISALEPSKPWWRFW